jgi:hypothetical protein
MNESVSAEDNVWYRQFYVWLIIFLPACAVAASFATLYIAAKNAPEMAVADYSSIEAIAAEQRTRDQLAAKLGLNAQLSFNDTAVTASIMANDLNALPATLVLRVKHSTTARLDREATLTGASGRYSGVIDLPAGAYDIQLLDPELAWRLSARTSGKPTTVSLIAIELVQP